MRRRRGGRWALERSAAWAALIWIGCPEGALDGSQEVYVPGDSFRQILTITTDRGDRPSVRVGEGLVLEAERRTGPWKAVLRSSLPEDGCHWVSAPLEHETDAAGSLRWEVEPPGTATFNIDLRLDGSREVRFAEPGVFVLTATSASHCGEPFEASPLSVTVLAG